MARRVLFVAEAVSLAHVARPVALADTLADTGFDIDYASSGAYASVHTNRSWRMHRIGSVDPDMFLSRLRGGKPVFTAAELKTQVTEDLRLLEQVRPDVVVGDFRLSLCVSARLARVPFISVCNAHWSAYAEPLAPIAPDLPMARMLGHRIFDPLFAKTWPLASRWHVRAINGVRSTHGLQSYARLSEWYCDGDVTLYADTLELVPLRGAPASHVFAGPIIWSPPPTFPDWWKQAMNSGPERAYITLGSTGDTALLPAVIDACRRAGLQSIVATAGRAVVGHSPPWVYSAPFLPGSIAAAEASLVVCNGGSATAHQALAQGRPVLGICSNLDQVLTMQRIAAAGAGILLRAFEATAENLTDAVRRLRTDPGFAIQAKRVRDAFMSFDLAHDFPRLVGDVVGASNQATQDHTIIDQRPA